MLSPLLPPFHSRLHQARLDHVAEQTSVAARSIPQPDPLSLSEHSSEHCLRASALPPDRPGAYDSLPTRSSKITLTAAPFKLAFILRTSTPSPFDQPTVDQQNKNKGKGESVKDADKDTMAPKSGYYESSHSSSDGDRVHYNPRREQRERSSASNKKKRDIVVTYGGKTGDPARKADIDGKRWK